MILYKITKALIRSTDADNNFNIGAAVLQGDTLNMYLLILCLQNVFRTLIDLIKENSFTLIKARNMRYPAETMKDADYAENLAPFTNAPDQAESLLHSLEQAAGGTGLYGNANKTECIYFKQNAAISTVIDKPLKPRNQFISLSNNISSTERVVNILLVKEWNVIDWLSIILKSDLSDKIKRDFFQAVGISVLLYRCTT